ncbi:hypothetical protein BH18ACT1_BH18ACT1_08140 [soil metagenome]
MRRALAVLLLPGLVACGDDGDGDGDQGEAQPGTTSTTSATTTAPSTTTTVAPEDESPVGVPTRGPLETAGFPQSTAPLVHLVEVRVAGQPGFDRVVFQLDGPVPAYRIEYVEEAVADGSGEPVAVRGGALLQVTMTPASGVDLTGADPEEIYTGPARFDAEGTAFVDELVRTGDFEGVLTWVIGVSEEVDVGVAVLEDPARLVIDLLEPE